MDWPDFLKNDRSRLIILVSVAVVLLGILIFVNLGSSIDGAISDLKSGKQKERLAAVNILLNDRSNGAYEALKGYAKDKDELIASAVIDALGRFGKKEDLSFFDELLSEPREGIRVAAVRALAVGGMFETDNARVLNVFQSDQSVRVRVEAARILGRHYYWAAMQSLVKALRDKEATVRAAAKGAIGKMGIHLPLSPMLDPKKQEARIRKIEKDWPDYEDANEEYRKSLKAKYDKKNSGT